jgi:hypothetical protein
MTTKRVLRLPVAGTYGDAVVLVTAGRGRYALVYHHEDGRRSTVKLGTRLRDMLRYARQVANEEEKT